jgi:endonuclease
LEDFAVAIYDRPVRLLLRDMLKELAPERHDVFTREQATSWFAQHYPRIKEGTVTAHLLRFSTNARSRVHYNPRPDEDILFQLDRSRFRRYDQATDPEPIRDGHAAAVPTDDTDDAVLEAPSEFAYESDLRDFLAKHPSIIEPGLRLYEEEGITGVEFPVGGRFVDVLAVDAANRLVVIELKVSRGYDRVVGQLLRYMAWVKQHQAEPEQGVRGIIIAREISKDLRLACSGIPNVELFEYELSVALRRVEAREHHEADPTG